MARRWDARTGVILSRALSTAAHKKVSSGRALAWVLHVSCRSCFGPVLVGCSHLQLGGLPADIPCISGERNAWGRERRARR